MIDDTQVADHTEDHDVALRTRGSSLAQYGHAVRHETTSP